MSTNHSRSALRRMVRKYLAGKATPEEEEFLNAWYAYFDKKEDGSEDLSESERLELQGGMEAFLLQKISSPHQPRIRPFFRVAAAAAVLILIATGAYLLWPSKTGKPEDLAKQDVVPGGNKAVLTLSDGTRITLDDAANGALASQGNITVKKTADGQLEYDVSAAGRKGAAMAPAYNTISTPAGGQYKVILPDGSKVWLNALSSLRFPVAFSANRRDVELTGEGYFEVAGNEMAPFQVAVNDMTVEVLGTNFNIMAYADEHSINTTLLEGAVRIVNGAQKAVIRPGQEARVKDDIRIAEADTYASIAWKEGFFVFRNEELKSVMRKLSRWYDVAIVYEGQVPSKSFTGKISRYKNISEVLEILKLTESINFRIEGPADEHNSGKRIIIMP